MICFKHMGRKTFFRRVQGGREPSIAATNNGKSQDRAASVALLKNFTGRIRNLRYDVQMREEIPVGFVQRHILRGQTASGAELAVPVCLVVHVEDGRIRKLYEYLDSAAIAPAFA